MQTYADQILTKVTIGHVPIASYIPSIQLEQEVILLEQEVILEGSYHGPAYVASYTT